MPVDIIAVNGKSKVFIDSFENEKIDVKDLRKGDNAFAAGQIGHILYERANTPNYSSMTDEQRKTFWSADGGAKDVQHEGAIDFESRIVSGMLGLPEGTRRTEQTIKGTDDPTRNRGTAFIYGNVRYNMYHGFGTLITDVKDAKGNIVINPNSNLPETNITTNCEALFKGNIWKIRRK
jgi:hypothetical protein